LIGFFRQPIEFVVNEGEERKDERGKDPAKKQDDEDNPAIRNRGTRVIGDLKGYGGNQ
jgi:hypothetical protein